MDLTLIEPTDGRPWPSPNRVIDAVRQVWGLSEIEFFGGRRLPAYSEARHVASAILREVFRLSWATVAHALQTRSCESVVYGVKKIAIHRLDEHSRLGRNILAVYGALGVRVLGAAPSPSSSICVRHLEALALAVDAVDKAVLQRAARIVQTHAERV